MAYENVLLVIIIAGLVLFGSKKLPELFRSLGRAHSEYEKARLQAQREFVTLHDDSNEPRTNRKNLEEIALKLDILNPNSLSDEDLRQSIQKKIGSTSAT
jgi:sec-independent protein translocase protein TatA